MNFGEIKTRVKRYGFDDSDPIGSWANEAYHEIEDNEDWAFLDSEATPQTTVALDTIVLPSDFFKLYTLRRTLGSSYLKYYDKVKFERLVLNKAATGIPCIFTIVGMDGIRLSPIPTVVETLTLFYQKQLADLVDDNDEPQFSTRHHKLIVYRAASIGLMTENEEDRAQTAQDEYELGLEAMKRAYSRKQKGQPATVQDVMEYNP